jgi:hypothetical protein
MEKAEEKNPSPAEGSMDRPPGASPAESGEERCTKAFNAETARFEDADEPCLNGEG